MDHGYYEQEIEKGWHIISYTDYNDIFETWDIINRYISDEYFPKTPRHNRPNLYILLDNSFIIQITVTHDAWGEYSAYIVQKNIERGFADELIKKQERVSAGKIIDFIKKYLIEYYYTLDEKVSAYKKVEKEYKERRKNGEKCLKKMKKFMKGISND